MTKKTYKLKGMHCTSCAMVIEGELEDIGVNAHCSYAKETVDINFDETKISEKLIKKTIKNSGYEAVEEN